MKPANGTTPWTEADPKAFAGEYVYRGEGAAERARLTLRSLGTTWAANYRSVNPHDGADGPAAAVDLSGVKVSGEGFAADPLPIKAGWPGFLPAAFKGKFVLIRSNEPGAPKKGLRLEGGALFFRQG